MTMHDWPQEALASLKAEKSESPHGCGDCKNAAWGSTSEASKTQRFHVIACAVGINLPGGQALFYCPFRNVDGMMQAGTEAGQDRGTKGPRQMQRPTP